ELYEWMAAAEVDMTIFFRTLSDSSLAERVPDSFSEAFYDDSKRQQSRTFLEEWLARYATRLLSDAQSSEQRRQAMRAANPRYVLRNWLAQQAIDKANAGDDSEITLLLDVMRRPYEDQPGRERFAQRRPDWARNKAGCSMLSCSS
ncbi:MAG: protein adenylyltransferase SelO family protein, partial [Dokdonella sp.]